MLDTMNALASKTQKPPKLPPQRKRFADAILAGTNQTQATIHAGYSSIRADQKGYSLMRIGDVIKYIAYHQLQIAERNRITQDEIVSGIREVITRLKASSARLKDASQASSAAPLLKSYELLAKMGGFLRDQGIDPEQRPAFVGISIHMGNGKIDVTHGNGKPVIDVTNQLVEKKKTS